LKIIHPVIIPDRPFPNPKLPWREVEPPFYQAAMLREALASAFLQHAVPKGLNFAFVELLRCKGCPGSVAILFGFL